MFLVSKLLPIKVRYMFQTAKGHSQARKYKDVQTGGNIGIVQFTAQSL